MKVAVIGGTGMGQLLFNLADSHSKNYVENTPYGSPVYYHVIRIKEIKIYFIDRHHSTGYFCLPHQLIKDKAQQRYMYVLSKKLGVEVVLATSAVGAIKSGANLPNPQVGDIYCPVDAIDYTSLPFTFSDSLKADSVAFHRSMDDIFCSRLAELMSAVVNTNIKIGGILGSTLQGPRFESRAEIERYRRDGVNFLSMSTCFPEAVLAREAGMSYGLLACVSNVCPEEPGISLDGQQVKEAIAKQQESLAGVLLNTIARLDGGTKLQNCACRKYKSVFDPS